MTRDAHTTTLLRAPVALAGLAAVALGAGIAAPAQATQPGRNGAIAFSQVAGEHRQLFTIQPDGTGLRQITHLDGEAQQPAWSPDGRRLAFGGELPDHAAVYTVRLDGSNLRELTPTGLQEEPSYSPDGRWIVFARDLGPTDSGVWLMRTDGTHLRRVTRNPYADGSVSAYDTDPAFSPDGTRISFVRVKGEDPGLGAIVTVRRDGSHPKRLTPWALDAARKHDWRPDGRLIVFSSYAEEHPGKSSNVFTVRPDGTHLRQLTHYRGGSDHAFVGSWSPNGRSIALKSNATGEFELYVMRADGTHLRQLTHGDDDPRAAAWGRRR